MSASRFAALTAFAFAGLALGSGAHASCIGGALLKGKFGTTVNGPITGGANTAEEYNGILVADGACRVTGSLTGGVFGQPTSTTAVTGTYTILENKQGTITIVFGGQTMPVTFGIGLIKDGAAAEVAGVSLNGPATASLDLTAIAPKTYALSSLSGTYVSYCSGASNSGSPGYGVELAYSIFDGAGNYKVVAIGNNNGGSFSTAIPKGTYTVKPNGSFSIHYSGSNSRYIVDGEIVNNGTEARAVLIDTTAGYGAYRTCFIKKQV